MRLSLLSVTFAALAAVPTASIAGAQASYVVDHTASHVRFLGRAMLQRVSGNSESVRGAITLWGDDLRTARGDVRFPIASIRTTPSSNEQEIAALFGGRASPDIVFHVDSIARDASSGRWNLDGRLSMNGINRPVRFRGTAVAGGGRLTAEGEAKVDLRRWGISPPTRFGGLVRMSPELTLSFRAEFLHKAALAAAQVAGWNNER